MTAIRGLEPSGFQGSPSPPSNNNNGDDDHRRIHPPTEENTTEDDDAEQELQEKEGGAHSLLPSHAESPSINNNSNDAAEGETKQSVAFLSGQQQQLAEEASRALSRLQIQSRQNSAVDSSNAIIVSDENRVTSSLDEGKHDVIVYPGATHHDDNDTVNNSNTQLVCTSNNDSNNANAQQDVSYGGALTVLPPNELSTTTSDAALAANTFTEMINDGVRRQQQQANVGGSGGLGGVGLSGGESLCPPGFYVDGSGVVRRSGAGSGGAGSYHHHGGLGGSGYTDNVGVNGAGINEKQGMGMAMNNGSPGNSGPGGGGGGGLHHRHHYNMAGGGGAVSTSAPSSSRPSGGHDPLETDIYHEEEDEDDEEDEEEEDSSEISASDEDGSWIAWFCGLRGNEFFCEVDEDYIQDDFNLTGLNGLVPYYDYALDMVLDVEMPMEDTLTEEQQEIVESAAEMLYGLIHARYIVTNRGMHAMYEKYRSASFGRCPHVFCQGQPVLPVGLSDLPRNYTVNVFCPRCHGLFFPKSTRQANIDGAYFGTTFPHLYLMNHPVSACMFVQFW